MEPADDRVNVVDTGHIPGVLQRVDHSGVAATG